MNSSDFKNLIVWQKSRILANLIYKLTEQFPKEELYGLILQIRRCAVSIISNIAEGQARGSKKEFIHHLYFSKGSAAELETQIYLSLDFGYISQDQCEESVRKINEIGRLLKSLINKLESS